MITDESVQSTASDNLGGDFITVWAEERDGNGGDSETAAKSREIVFVDTAADDYEDLVADIINNADSTRDFDVLLLDASQDGIAQITSLLAEYDDLDAIHIVSHGMKAAVKLGNTWLTVDNLDGYAGDIAGWQNSLSSQADLLIYGCDLAGNIAGQTLVESLSALTEADVAASVNDTGHAIFGGDWDLEYATGHIETDVAFSVDVQQNWAHLLNVTVDASSSGSTADQASVTVSHTTSGTNRHMLVGVSMEPGGGESVTSVTYNGTSLSLVRVQSAANARVEIWELVAPDTGTHNVVVNLTSGGHKGVAVGVMTFNGVHQWAPTLLSSGASGNSSSASTTVMSATNDMVFGVVAVEKGTSVTPGAGQTEYWDIEENNINGAGTTKAGAASVTTSWTVDNGDWAAASVSIQADTNNYVAKSFTLSAVKDSYIKKKDTTTNYGTSGSMVIDRESGDLQRALVQFDLSSIASGATIANATLKLNATQAGGGMNVGAYQVLQAWDEGSVTWNNRSTGTAWSTVGGDFDATAIDIINTSTTGLHNFDVTSLAQDWIDGASNNYGILVGSPDGGGDRTNTYDSREGTVAPILEFQVLRENYAPTAINSAVSSDEDTVYTFGIADFNFSDPDGDNLDTVKIKSLELVGDLELSGVDVTLNQVISAADIAAGNLKFTPLPNEIGTGYDSFQFQVFDACEFGSSIYTMTVNVDPVNDEPSFTVLGNQSVDNDAVPYTVTGFASALPGGGPDEVSQTFTYTVANNNTGMFAAGPAIDASGTLTFTLAASTGTATVDVFVTDSGGTSNGGDNTSATLQFDIIIVPVNDRPTATIVASGFGVNEDDSYRLFGGFSVSDVDAWGADLDVTLTVNNGQIRLSNTSGLSFNAGANETGSMTITGNLTDLNNALATFSYRPNANFNGNDTVTMLVNDLGNTGGGALSHSDTANIAVAAVNDAPTITDSFVVGLPGADEDSTTAGTTVSAIVNNASWSDVDTGAVRGIAITSITGNGTWQYSTDAITWNSFGSVSATSALLLSATTQVRYVGDGLSGEIPDFTFRAWDTTTGSASTNATPSYANPGLGGGSSAFSSESASAAATITSINDEPSFTMLGNQSVDEGSGFHSVVGFAAPSPGGGWDEASQTFTFTVSNNNASLFAVGPAIDSSGTLTYTLAANANGTATIDVYLTDSGGTANGGDNTSPTQQFDIIVDPTQIVLYISTAANVTASGAPGLDDWTAGDVLEIGDPNIAFEPGTTNGTLYNALMLGDFASDGDARLAAVHVVQSDITLGGATQPSINLLAGDMLLAVADNGETFTGSDAISISPSKKDVFVFRPDTLDDYSSGKFFILLDDIGTNNVAGITLIEQATLVGDQPLAAGTFLINLGNSRDIHHFSADDVGVGHTLGAMSTLISGADIGLGSGSVKIAGLDLLEDDIALGATMLKAGNILVTLDGDDPDLGANHAAVTANDVFYLDVRTTTMFSGTTDADAFVLIEGADLNLSGKDEEINALSMVVTFGGGNLDPVIGMPGSALNFTENDGATIIDASGTVLDVDAINFDGGSLNVDFTAGATANDRLAIHHEGTAAGEVGVSGSNVTYGGITIGTFTGGASGSNPLAITFNGFSTQAAVEAVLQNITYDNVSENPTTSSRTVRVVLTDGQGGTSNVETEIINIAKTNDVPIALNDSYNVVENGVLTVIAAEGVLANDTDDDFDVLTAGVLVGPINGGLAFDSLSGAFTYTPDLSFIGVDTFTYLANDGTVDSAITTVTITVKDVNDPPTDIIPDTFAIEEFINTTGGRSLGKLTATDPDAGETFTYSIQPGLDGAAFSIGGAAGDELLIDDGVLDTAIKSSYSVTVRVTDSGSLWYDETLTVAVTPTTAGWVLNGDTFVAEGDAATYTIRVIESIALGSSASADITLTDIDTDSADYADFVTAINNAIVGRSDLTFDGTTLTYTPVSDYSSSYNPTGGGFLDISATGTDLGLGDETNALASIGFNFDFYGSTETQLYVHDNGYVTFGSGINNQYNNQSMAAGTALGGRAAIAAYWDDMDPGATGNVFVETIGTAGNRQFIIQWDNVPYYNGGTSQTGSYQIVLSEATGEIEFRYDDVDFNGNGHDNGRSATIAIQDGSGLSTQHSFNTANSVVAGSTVTFKPSLNTMIPLTFTLATIADDGVEGNEDYSIDLSNPVGTTLSAVNPADTTIIDDDLPPIATDNANAVVEDVTLTATGNLITDDDGFGVDFVDSTIAKSALIWANEFSDGEALATRTVDGVEIDITFADPDGISSTPSFVVQSVNPQGGSTSYAAMSIDAPNGLTSSRMEITTTFDQLVQDLSFTLYDIDNGTTWGDDIIVHAFNGATAVAVTLTPVSPGRHNVTGNHVEAVGGVVAATSTNANVLVQIDGPIDRFVIDYGYASYVTTTNADYQIMGISDFDFQRFNYAVISTFEAETDPGVDVSGTYGTIDWDADGDYVYTLDNNNGTVQALGVGETLVETFDYTITDLRGDTDTGTLTITINGTNDLPIVDLNDDGTTNDRSYSDTFTEGGSAVAVTDVDATMIDIDGDVALLTIALGGFVDSGSEQLSVGSGSFSFGSAGSTTQSFGGTDFSIVYDGGTLISVTKDGGGSIAVGDLSLLIRAISYQNVSPFPTAGIRTINFTANDGTIDSNTAVSTITVSRNAESVEWSIVGTDPVAEGAAATYTISQSSAMRNGETAQVILTLTNTSASASDHANFISAVQAAVAAYSGPGSLGFNSSTNLLTFISAGTGKMADLVVSLPINSDSLLESDEDFTVALSSPSSTTGQTVTIASGAGSVATTINDGTTSIATITANDPAASETGSNPGQFIVDLGAVNRTGSAITVNYSVAGTATAGTDYAALSGSVTVADGAQTATIDVIGIVDDSRLENAETVILTLTTTSLPSVSVDPQSATVTIADNDTAEVFITANDASASEPSDDGQFTVTMSAVSDRATVVTYTVGGTATAGADYTTLTGTVTIAAGTTSATIDVETIDNSILEENETVIVTLTATADVDVTIDTAPGADNATVTIVDNDSATVSIVANDATAAEPGDDGQFTVTMTSASDKDTVINYAVTGTAGSGADFTAISGSVTILAGSTSAVIDVATIDNAILEDNEIVVVTLTGTDDTDVTVNTASGANTATVTIADDDTATVSITANDPTAAEPGDDGQFTVMMSAASDRDTVINYSVAGTAGSGADFTALSGSVTILAGSTSAVIDVATIDNAILEDNETVIVTLTGTNDTDVTVSTAPGANTATVTIADDDTASVSITANDSAAAEPANDGQFTVTMSATSDKDTVINYSVTGAAGSGSDFTALSGSVTILAGSTSALIDVVTIDNAILEDNETVIVTLTGSDDSDVTVSTAPGANTATVTIADDDTATVSIMANDPAAAEPANDGQFTVTMSAASDKDTVINYSVTGTAGSGSDFTALSGNVTILAGSTSAVIDVATIDDAILEDNETVIVTLTGTDDTDVTVSTVPGANTATVTIADDDSATVSITANDSTAAEPGDDGQFTVTMSATSDKDTVINYSVTGTTGSGSDFTALSGSVTILAGSTSAVIDVETIDNAILEDNETVIVTLTGTDDTDVTVSTAPGANTATVTIADNDTATVSITANDPAAAELANDGQFTVTMSAASDKDTVINYSVAGTAGSGADFTALSGNVTILAGSTSAVIDVATIDDAILEDNETVIVTLTGTDDSDVTVSTAPGANTATVTIADNDTATVSITANDPAAAEPGDDGQFTVTMSAASDKDTIVNYSVTGTAGSGSDFTALSGSVTILAGATSAVIDVATIDDAILEDNETVIVTLTGSDDSDVTVSTAPGANTATVTIADNDTATVSITANDPAAAEPGDDGQFTVTMSAASDKDTIVNYSVTGTAGSGSDFTALSGSVTILAGATSAVINVATIDNAILEDNETVIVTLTGTDDTDVTVDTAPGANTATVTIADDDTATVSITANNSTAAEPANDGQFTVTMSAASDKDTIVNYSVTGTAGSGADFTALSGSVTILAGSTSALIDVATVDNAILEDHETVIVTLTGTDDADVTVSTAPGANTATVTIADNDTATVSITANDSAAAEPANDGQFTVTMSAASDKDTVINYSVAGTAGSGADFTALSGSVTILAGATSAVIDVATIDDAILEDNETVIVTLTGSDDSDVTVSTAPGANTATVTIADNDTATVSITANDSAAAEPGDDGQFTVTMSAASDKDTIVNYSVTGTAGSGSDFTALSGSVTILAGSTSALIDVVTIDNAILEDNETVIVTLTGTDDTDVTVSTAPGANTATVTIADDDTATVSITANDPAAAEPANDGQFTVTMSAASDKDTVINYSVAGTAGSGSDFTALSGSVTILAGSTTAVIDVATIDNTILEDNETVIVTLTGTDDDDVTVDTAPGANTATVTIADDDIATVAITANDPSAAEPSDQGQFTVTMSAASDKDTVVNYSVTGTAGSGADFTVLSGSVTILAGSTSAVIDVATIDNAILEDNETVIVTLTGSDDTDVTVSTAPGANTATVTIADNDTATVSITANDSAAAEPANDGQFTVTMSAVSDKDTVINYSVTGTAGSGSDFTALSGSVTILAGSTSALIDVATIDNAILEDNETVIVTLTGTDDTDVTVSTAPGANTATVTIADNDTATVSITANDSTASEPANDGQFTVTMSAASDKETVINYSVTGTAGSGMDFTALSGSVTILAGSTSALIDVATIDNTILEDNETVIVTLTGTDDTDVTVSTAPGANTATVTIADNDTATVSITANDSAAAEPANDGQFTVTMSAASDKDTIVNYAVTGTAGSGADFTVLSGNVTIMAGSTSALIDVATIDNAILEDNETVIVTLTGTDDTDVTVSTAPGANTATVTIADNDTASVSITANDPAAAEPANDGQFTVTMSAASDKDTVVNYSVTGTAGSGSDFTALSGSVTILAGSTSALIDVATIDNAILEDNETVIVTLTGTDDADVTVSTAPGANTATVTIADDDTASVSITANDPTAAEPANDGHFTVTMSAASDKDTVINYSVTGTAGSGADFTALSGSVTILAGSTTAVIDVATIDNAILEDNETVIVTLTGTDDTDVTVSTAPGANTATVTIADDDKATVAITANDATAAEPANDGQFTVTMSAASDKDTVINYSVAGTAGSGSDFTALSGSVTILAGSTTAVIDVATIDNTILEDNETVIVTLTGTDDADVTVDTAPGANTATVTIVDDDIATVAITANDPSAAEPSDQGQFTVTMSAASDKDTVVNYSVTGTAGSGADFTALSGSVTILAGSISALIDVATIDNAILEDNETVIVTLTGSDDSDVTVSTAPGANTATVTIADNDTATVSITANDSTASEPANDGQFTVTMSAVSDKDTVVNYSVTGTAGSGADFTALSGSVTILAGSTSALIDVATIDNAILEDNETVIVTLTGTDDADVTVDTAPGANTATVTIADDDIATVVDHRQ